MGVSNAAKNTLNKKPFNKRTENLSHDITLKEHNKNKTAKVSTNCENNVEALFLSHKCLPLVIFLVVCGQMKVGEDIGVGTLKKLGL